MRAIGLSIVVVVLAASSVVASSAAAPAPALSGKMTQMQYLVGTWACTTKIPAMGKMHAQTISAKDIYWIETVNVIGSYYSSKPYSSSGFIGWNNSKKIWWSDGADVYGTVGSSTGPDSGTNVQVMTGPSWSGGKVSTGRDTMTKTSDTSYTDHFELLQGGKVIFQGTSACTKTSNKTM
jgi:hypothetical protein